MKTNSRRSPIYTHEGAKAKRISVEDQLKRSVLSCLLWEREFYESGQSISDRILSLSEKCDPSFLRQLAFQARTAHKLRHAPLMILLALIKKGGKTAEDAIFDVISRPDELSELVSLYWRDGKKPLSAAMKRGLARAFTKFDRYQITKWNKPYEIKLRDVMFLVHPKPKDKYQAKTFKMLAEGTLPPPDTWESRLTAGQDKKDVFTDLIKRKKLGYMALLRNLRGMLECGVDENLISEAILNVGKSCVLPYRFIAAAKHAPRLERYLDEAMVISLKSKKKIRGKTIVLVDVSASMSLYLSAKSDLRRIDAACGLAILLSEICSQPRVFTFSDRLVEVAPRRGMALSDAIKTSQPNRSTYLGASVKVLNDHEKYDRLIVITDEQTGDVAPDPKGKGYMMNVASYRNGVGYGSWCHIDGFSEACVDFIQELEG